MLILHHRSWIWINSNSKTVTDEMNAGLKFFWTPVTVQWSFASKVIIDYDASKTQFIAFYVLESLLVWHVIAGTGPWWYPLSKSKVL